jgi:ABC-type iron transport system FetAB ATPase subunit
MVGTTCNKSVEFNNLVTSCQRLVDIGRGKVMWYQQKVSTQKARVPRSYVIYVAENKEVPDRNIGDVSTRIIAPWFAKVESTLCEI